MKLKLIISAITVTTILTLSYFLYIQIQRSAELSSSLKQLEERIDHQENQLQEYLIEQGEISKQNIIIRNELSEIQSQSKRQHQFLLELRNTDEEYNDWNDNDLPSSIVEWLQQQSTSGN